MNAYQKIFKRIPLQQYFLKEKSQVLSCTHLLYFKSNYSHTIKNYPKAIIKNNIVISPFNDIEIDSTSNLNTFLWSRIKWMNKTAVVCGITGASYTYGELKTLTQIFGYSLLNEGFKPGQTIAVVLGNFLITPVVLLSLITAGLSICSINPVYTADEIKHQLINSNAVGVITYSDIIQNVQEAISKVNKGIKLIVTPGLNNDYNNLNNNSNIILYDELIKKNCNNRGKLLEPPTQSRDLFHISHTSGTTGLPKGIWLSHGNFVNNILQSSYKDMALMIAATENKQETVLLVLPLFHNYALNIFTVSIYAGAKIILLPKFDGKTFLNYMEQYKVTFLAAVPPIVQYLLGSGEGDRKCNETLKTIMCAGAPLTLPEFKQIFSELFPKSDFRHAYGLSESSCFTTLTPPDYNSYQTVGLPLSNIQIRVANLDNKAINLGPNDEGEICVKGPQMTSGYINNPKATEEIIDKDGWFHTGDIGYYDHDGYFYIVDRLKDMIKVKGFQVSPAELELVLKGHELVEDAAVLGVQHPKKGEVPIAFITISSNTKEDQSVIKDKLLDFMKTKLAPYKQLEQIVFVKSIPKTLSGKILKKELKLLL